MTQQSPLPPDHLEKDEINLVDILLVFLKRKKLIITITLTATLISVVVSLLWPRMYTATAQILPPKDSNSGASALLAAAGSTLGTLAGGMGGMGGSSADLYVGILKSRNAADALITRFDLKTVYDEDYLEDVHVKLGKRTDIDADTQTGIVSVSVEDRDPKRAAEMANAYVEALDRINRTVNVTEGQRKRVFLEKRLTDVKKDLIAAETTLKQFQEKHKIISLDAQANAAIEGASRIKAEIILSQTQLEVLKKFGTERQNEAIMLNAKIDELEKQLARIEIGKPEENLKQTTASTKDVSDFYLPFSQLPELGLHLFRLTREAKIQEEVFKLLTSQYELAKIDEAKDVNTIQVLDRAVPPDKKSSPKRALIIILSVFFSFFLATLVAFLREYSARFKTENAEDYQRLIQGVKVWKHSRLSSQSPAESGNRQKI
ncbi:MAG: lipopolysaccharide biosynthesis protein [Deltaproteobacteria bacterium HGW-Deltaproteobacteria-21]|nr:MAG: lipopolysaccharide biosynthesis protein [Deltaproteobacteria bacterium HGW-Deltaproteobacteria-21]